MKIIDWNISCFKTSDMKFKYLLSLVENDEFVVVLQEVTQIAYQKLAEVFQGYSICYSLDYRPVGKFDTKSRGLGVAIITSKKVEISRALVLDRTLLPERTLFVECSLNNRKFSVLGLHSITGCDHKKAKSLQFCSFAEAIDAYKPDVVCIDANEPEIDNIFVNEMKFFDNKDKGYGAETFFKTMINCNLADTYVIANDNASSLPYSHIVSSKYKKRYDFIFANTNKFKVKNMTYDYKNGILNGSDHAVLIADVDCRID